MDDDKRRLLLYQERYLADGDLHSDGPGRARRFRWKNMGEFFQQGFPLIQTVDDKESCACSVFSGCEGVYLSNNVLPLVL